ncbi:MAG: pseudaminic acid biosynthesis-associated methylase [Patescibacteria group bacterium]
MKQYATAQEKFWATKFGDDYIQRNTGKRFLENQKHYFKRIFKHIPNKNHINSVLEFGANIGMNLRAIHALRPRAALTAIEINATAAQAMREWSGGSIEVFNQSILDFRPHRRWDLVFIKGVLIHVNPKKLPIVYKKLYESSAQYICVGEYYNPSPVMIPYRGYKNRLFKRDFCGEIMDRYPRLKLVAYGFNYHRDPHYPQDDITWFLLKK